MSVLKQFRDHFTQGYRVMRQDTPMNQEVGLLREYGYVAIIEGGVRVSYRNLILLQRYALSGCAHCHRRYVAAVGAEFGCIVYSHSRHDSSVYEQQETKQGCIQKLEAPSAMSGSYFRIDHRDRGRDRLLLYRLRGQHTENWSELQEAIQIAASVLRHTV